MSATLGFPAPPLLAAVWAGRAGLAGLSGAPRSGAWSLSTPELGEALRSLLALRAQVEGLLGAVTREAEQRGAATETGARNTAAWVRSAGRLDPYEARELVAAGQALDPDAAARPGSCPATGAALRDGRIHPAQAKAIVAALRVLPSEVDDEPGLRERAETWLVEQAAALDARELAAAGRGLRETLVQRVGAVDVDDPAEAARLAAEAERAVYEQRSITRHRQLPGLARVRMLLPEDVAGALFAALDPLAAPRPGEDGVRDWRTPAQRRADAFEELLDLATGTSPEDQGETPDPADPADPGEPTLTEPGENTPAEPTDPGPAEPDKSADRAPAPGGRAGAPRRMTQLLVTMSLEALEARRPHPGWLDTGEQLTAGQLRRLLCDAGVLPVVLGGDSQPLDVGRARRAFTPAQRAAILVRDGGCAGPGCDPHPWRAHAHHFDEWGHGGPTDTAKGGLLCPSWHRRVHAEGWEVRLAANGHPELIPPAWIDPQRRPRQNFRFRSLPAPDDRSATPRKPQPHQRN